MKNILVDSSGVPFNQLKREEFLSKLATIRMLAQFSMEKLQPSLKKGGPMIETPESIAYYHARAILRTAEELIKSA